MKGWYKLWEFHFVPAAALHIQTHLITVHFAERQAMTLNLRDILITLIVALIAFSLLFLGYSVGKKSVKHQAVLPDTAFVKGDTVYIPKPIRITKIVKIETPSEKKDTKQYYSLDTSFYSNKDHMDVLVELTVDSLVHWDFELQHQDYMAVSVDTVKIPYPVTQEVTKPFYKDHWFYTSAVAAILLILKK